MISSFKFFKYGIEIYIYIYIYIFYAKILQSFFLTQYVPAGFAKNYIGSDQTVKLQTSDKKHWSFHCNYHHGASKVMRMGNGWSAFSKDNNLQGDVCLWADQEDAHCAWHLNIHVVDHAVN